MQDLIHLGLENSQGWRWHSFSGKPVSLLGCPHGVKVPYIQSEILVLTYVHCLLSLHYSPLWRAWRSHLNDLLIGIGKLLLGPLQIHLFSRLNMSSSLTLLIGRVLQPPECLGGPPLNCLQFINVAIFFIHEHAKSVLPSWEKRRANSVNISEWGRRGS